MYIQKYKREKKSGTYTSLFIAESYREDGKVKRRHLANISKLPPELQNEICNLVYNLKDKNITLNDIEPIQGKSCGTLLAFKHLAKETGLLQALGKDKQAKLALIQIIYRIVCQQSRNYVANEWSKTQAIKEIFKLDDFSEDSLYQNLDWLSEHQEKIENRLSAARHPDKSLSSLFLYDVTSSYFEGTQNELAEFGYNRDKKRGKKQIVIGLLCDNKGYPVTIEVFKGNTSDSTTVHSQVKKLAHRFKVKDVVLVGDRGMIKRTSIEELNEMKWGYITAITKAQINSLLNEKVIEMELFTEELIEVENQGVRYVLHKNTLRARELAKNREEKRRKLELLQSELNQYLAQHPRASVQVALTKLNARIHKLKVNRWLQASCVERKLELLVEQEELEQEQKLDGCYIIKSNVSAENISTKDLHDRYKDLSMVEQAFRTCKQSIEEIRPIYVRKSSRTKGHVFVCMLAYILVKRMGELCSQLNMSRKGIINQLDQLQYTGYKTKKLLIKVLPKSLSPELEAIVSCLKVKLPSHL